MNHLKLNDPELTTIKVNNVCECVFDLYWCVIVLYSCLIYCAYMFFLVTMDVITPSDPNQRGCQLSLRFSCLIEDVHQKLHQQGIIVSYLCNHYIA